MPDASVINDGTRSDAESAARSGHAIAPPTRRRLQRLVLMGLVPTVILAAALFAYLQAGRYVSTDNAYVKGHVVNIAPEIAGPIAEVAVDEYEKVERSALLFRLRDEPYRIALARAEAALSQAASDINADRQAYQRALAEIAQFQATTDYARTQYERQVRLRRSNLGSAEDLDTANYALETALKQVEVARKEAATLLARLNGDSEAPVEVHPRHLAAQAEHRQALLDLERTQVRAPFAGVVTNRPEPGDYAERGRTVMALVADEGMWIEANFKETQLTHITVGQPVRIEVDTYPGLHWDGSVLSLSEATGAEFALLPPQNATGNWVKIVQRIPVRIAIAPHSGQPPLRAGMSTVVTVDTGHIRSWRELLRGH